MKKLICLTLIFIMTAALCAPVTAVEAETPFVPETFTREQLLAMDPEVDSDGDGLVDVLELYYELNRYDADTDGDGVSDYIEFCVTCTDPLTPDGHIDTDGDGLTNAQEGIYGTNPDDLDTDNDNLGDYDEIMVYRTDPLVKNNTSTASGARGNDDIVQEGGGFSYAYTGTLHTKYGEKLYASQVSYNLQTSWFLENNKSYNWQLATVSALLSAIAYEDSYLSNVGTTEETSTEAISDWFNYHGFTGSSGWDTHDHPDYYLDQHMTQSFVAYKPIAYNGTTKYLVCVVIRGTNETLEEWQSDFDVGGTSTSHEHWLNSSNHMGFDITANRIEYILDYYLNQRGFNSSNSIIWITGHSRGAAIANIIAANKIDDGFNVFGYCFATPGTTTSSTASAAKYKSIFNIINEDDLVPQLPMDDWGFTRYGEIKSESIEDEYASDWDSFVSGYEYYRSNKTNTINLTQTIANIANDRNDCYTYRSDASGYIFGSGADYSYVLSMRNSTTGMFPYCTTEYWYSTITYRSQTLDYEYRIYQQPAFLLRYMAYAMSEGYYKEISFVFAPVAPYLSDARSAIISASGTIKHPHYPESYYLLATKLR